jgi:hypothetical protein
MIRMGTVLLDSDREKSDRKTSKKRRSPLLKNAGFFQLMFGGNKKTHDNRE